MLRRIPQGIVAKLLYASGIVWMLFGVLIFFALVRGFLWNGISTPFDGLVLPVFGVMWLGPDSFRGTDLVISWIHTMGFLLGSGLSIMLGLAICVYVAPPWQRRRA